MLQAQGKAELTWSLGNYPKKYPTESPSFILHEDQQTYSTMLHKIYHIYQYFNNFKIFQAPNNNI